MGKKIFSLVLGLSSLFINPPPVSGFHGKNIRCNFIDSDTGKVYRLDGIIITATRTERNKFDVPRDVTVVERDLMEDKGYKFTPDALEENASILIQKTNYGGGAPILRGLIGNQILILIDGIRLNNSTYRFGPNQYLSTVSPALVDHIEIIAGPGSVLYGSDALGGVVNIISRTSLSPWKNPLHAVTTISSADQSIVQTLEVRKRTGRVGFIAGGAYRKHNDLRSGAGVQKPTGFRGFDGHGRIDYYFSDYNVLSLAYNATELRDVPRTDRIVAGNDIKYMFEPQRRELAYVKFEGRFRSSFISRLNATISFNRQTEGRDEISTKKPTQETVDRDQTRTIGILLDMQSSIGKNHLLIYGGDFYGDVISSERMLINLVDGTKSVQKPQFPDNSGYQTLGLFIQDQWHIDPVTLFLGARYSAMRFSGILDSTFGEITSRPHAVTFSSNILYSLITDKLNLIAGISQGFRAPNLDDIAVFGKAGSGSGARFDVPSPDVQPEKSICYEIGLKCNYKLIEGGLFLHLSEFSDFITPKPSVYNGHDTLDGFPVYTRDNIINARIFGIQSVLRISLADSWECRGSFSSLVGDNFTDNEPLSRIPPMRGGVGLRYFHEHYWFEYDVTLSAKQVRLSSSDIKDSRIGENGTPGSLYHTIRGGMKYFKALSFSLICENIFNKLYKFHGSGIYGPGRNLTLSVILDI